MPDQVSDALSALLERDFRKLRSSAARASSCASSHSLPTVVGAAEDRPYRSSSSPLDPAGFPVSTVVIVSVAVGFLMGCRFSSDDEPPPPVPASSTVPTPVDGDHASDEPS